MTNVKTEQVIDPTQVVHFCNGMPRYYPHWMGVPLNGKLVEVTATWNPETDQWENFKLVEET